MDSLVDALQIKYPTEVVGGSNITNKMLESQAPRMRRLMALQPSLTFKQSTFQEALRAIADKASNFGMSDADTEEFVEQGAARLMRLCRKVAQAKGRAKQPEWYVTFYRDQPMSPASKRQRLFPKAAGDGIDEAPSSAIVAAAPTPTHSKTKFVYGYDHEQDACWRCKYKTPMDKEYSRDVSVGAHEHAPVVATVPNGTKYEIAELTTGAFKERASAIAKATPPRAHRYFDKMCDGGRRIVVRDRKDRSDVGLRSMFVDGAQRCQIDLGAKLAPPVEKATAIRST